jgi:nucleoside-diphosphate-sugar epimerase
LKLLITGGLGYIGSVLTRKALDRGHKVKVLDLGHYKTPLVESAVAGAEVIESDLCEVTPSDLEGVAWAFHLGGISNDGSADISERITYRVNVGGTRTIAEACAATHTPMIFASTASVYGSTWFELSCEDSRLNPQSLYAESKVKAEEALNELAMERGLRCIILRQATVFGWSPRMRYDLVVNALLKSALDEGRMVAQGGGEVWRPLVYVGDLANVWLDLAESRTDKWWACQHACPVFNVAHHEANRTKPYRISELVWWMQILLKERGIEAEMVRESLGTPDRRDYTMDATRLQHAGFLCPTGITPALDEMLEHIRAGECADFPNDLYYNVRVQKRLLGVE